MRQPRQVSQVPRSTRTLVCVQCEHDECYRGSTGGDCSEDRLLEIAHALSDLSHNRRSPAHRLNVSPAHAQRDFIRATRPCTLNINRRQGGPNVGSGIRDLRRIRERICEDDILSYVQTYARHDREPPSKSRARRLLSDSIGRTVLIYR